MRAAVYRSFGGPEMVRVEELPKPVPRAGEVLIRVHASTVSVGDYRMRTRDLPKGLEFFGPLTIGIYAPRKKVLGMDFAGTIEAVGDGVTRFKLGDAVVGLTGMKFGGHAEYITLNEREAMVLKPEGWSFTDAVALVFGGHTVAECIRQCPIKPGDEVLVNGASGAVGTSAVQVAKHFGAVVTAVTSAGNAELVRSLGADHVVDYTRDDFTAGAARYDIILDNVGSQDFADMARVMAPGGIIVVVGGSKKGPFLGPIKRIGWSKLAQPFIDARVTFFLAKVNKTDLELLANLARAGQLESVIDRRYPLERTGAALEYLGAGHARGKVVVTVD
jgi:NADPH:quinone reductase-like Zn-dependent oxidoreductase